MAGNESHELPAGPPKFDLVGPTVDDDLRRIITRYGIDSVKAAVKRQVKSKRGRKPEKDWAELRDVIEADARDWLAGRNPAAARSNYSIAKDFAEKNPGHSRPATMQRIERKLAKQRAFWGLVTAERLSRDGYPYAVHLRALEALCDRDPHPVWEQMLERAKSEIADYEAKKGEVPSPDLSMTEVEAGARMALIPASTINGLATFAGNLQGPAGLLGAIPMNRGAK